ncbi:M28 family peptidase [Paraflavisolibacter sp. H34]|uniref:M28 family peptidase n=1 Tax=Huijunlia imazamoxiresistens TaxID=3127457 RepID=UPI003015D55A
MIRLLLFLLAVVPLAAPAQTTGVINAQEVLRIEKVLAADSLGGRQAGTPGLAKAAAFIASEFKAAGLQTLSNAPGYLQSFKKIQTGAQKVSWKMGGRPMDAKRVVVVSSQPRLEVTEQSGYKIKTLSPGANPVLEAMRMAQARENSIVLVNEAYASGFLRLGQYLQSQFAQETSTIFILSNAATLDPFAIDMQQQVEGVPLSNVVGILPGKSRPDEYVIFSAHYDHLGIGAPVEGDSIFNGANDDAAGTTAVILLAKHFQQLANNERTLVFAAFTGEEEGGFGSQYFSQRFNPAQVVAMFNIEMIGTESKWGKNSAYITGFDRSDMGAILQRNLKGTPFTFHPDPYPDQQLFYRSDNATLARLGVPAHTISTSKMDNEPYYHTVDDEWETLDPANMAEIIRAIAESSKSIISGKDTPARVSGE